MRARINYFDIFGVLSILYTKYVFSCLVLLLEYANQKARLHVQAGFLGDGLRHL